jgi:hypothetical protein
MATGVLFRSELMCRCQLYLPPEAAYNCVAELGELGMVFQPEEATYRLAGVYILQYKYTV